MQAHARLSGATTLETVDMMRPRSNFDFIEARFPELVTLRRLMSLVRQHSGRTIMIERLEVSKDFKEEDEDIRKLCPDFSRSVGVRLSFFKKRIPKRPKLNLLTDDDLIGYAIIKRDFFGSEEKTRVFESVIRSPDRPNNFIKREPIWPLRVANKIFRVKGHIYAQQNGITNCCGHVAVRTAAASFGGRDLSYREMNKILGLSRKKRRPGDGIELAEMVKLLNAAGARCFEADYRAPSSVPPPPFQKYVYGSVESGFPAIISFQTTSDPNSYHAIPTFGHTFNADTWVPSAERSYFQIGSGTRYIPSESWVSTEFRQVNSVGHLVKAFEVGRSAEEMWKNLGLPEEDWANFKVGSLGQALIYAMQTINGSAVTVSGKATELLSADREGSNPDQLKCPIALPPNLQDKDYCEYFGHYHTDFTLPAEYFRPDVKRPDDIRSHMLDFTYLFGASIENPAHSKMGRGIRVRAKLDSQKRISKRDIRRTFGKHGLIRDHPELKAALEQD